jgi:N6-adenosine-specific RNA methylase IME4
MVCVPLPCREYGVIYADPPWSFRTWSDRGKGRSAENHYAVMSDSEIRNLPVADIAAPSCALFLWTTGPKLFDAKGVIEAWGFNYKTIAFTWVKLTQAGRPAFGCGYWTRANAEMCLLATRGSPKRLHADVPQVVLAPRREHSRKPDEVAARIERLVAGPYIELFARQLRPGWDGWGDHLPASAIAKAPSREFSVVALGSPPEA